MMVKLFSVFMVGEFVRLSCLFFDFFYGLEVRFLQVQLMFEGYFDLGIWLGYVLESISFFVRVCSDVIIFVSGNYVVDVVFQKCFVN